MSKSLLITRPKYEPTTHYLYYWSQVIINLARQKCLQVLDLNEKKANKKNVHSMLEKMKPDIVCFNGHGSHDSIAGQDDEIIITASKDAVLLAEKIIYSRSCKTCLDLGPKSINAGALSFIGYYDDFVFFYEEKYLAHPLNDPTATLFLDPSNYIMIKILKGHSTGEANALSIKYTREIIQKLSSSDSDNNYLVPYLMCNMLNQVCLGDNDIRLL